MSITGGSDIEQNKDVGEVSTIMGALKSKIGALSSHFDKIDYSEAQIKNTSISHLVLSNHDIPANKGKVKRQLPFEHLFGVCKTFKKVKKQRKFHLMFKKLIYKISFLHHQVIIVK